MLIYEYFGQVTHFLLFGLYSLFKTKMLKNKTIGKIDSVLWRSHLCKIKVITRVILKFGESV